MHTAERPSIDTYRLGDVLDLLFAEVFEVRINLSIDRIKRAGGNAYALGFGQGFQPRGYVDPVAIDVGALNDDIP